MTRLYLDYNATSPIAPEALAAMSAFAAQAGGNPSSPHAAGQISRLALDRARRQVARLIHAEPDEIIFTSGGTEANNLATLGVAAGAPDGQVVTTTIEHQSLLNPCRRLTALGRRVVSVAANAEGWVAPARVGEHLAAPTILVSVMLANNDTGAIQPVAEIAALARARGVFCHTDAVQAAGRIPVDVRALGVDALTLSAHKLRGPPGVGALYVRRSRRAGLSPLFYGGAQERGLRPGTENSWGIVGFGAACELALNALAAEAQRLAALRDRLEAELLALIPGAQINARNAPRLPNTSNIRFADVDAEALAMNLDALGMDLATGSACSAAEPGPSHVLLGMGQTLEEARGALRISLGHETTPEVIAQAVPMIRDAARRMRETRP